MLDYINTNIDIMDAINMAYTIYKFPSLDTKQIHIPITELSDDMKYGGGIGWVFIMDRKQNTEILHDFIFNDIEPDESNFDYNSLREALYEYRNGEWKDGYEDDDNTSNQEEEDEESNDEWD